jgi:hypothetical protein
MGFLNDFLKALGIKKDSQGVQEQKADIKKDFTAPVSSEKNEVKSEPVVKKDLEQPSQEKSVPERESQDPQNGQPATSIEELEKRMQSDSKIKFQKGGPGERNQEKE